MKKSIIAAGAASVALAAMPIVGVFADDDRAVTDTINVTVSPSCTFSAGGDNVSYSATGTNATGAVNPVNNDSNVHSFTVFCNNNAGYNVTAVASALTESVESPATPTITDNFAYKATLPTAASEAAAKKDGAWNAAFAAASGNVNTLTVAQLPDGGTSTKIISSSQASAAAGETFTATYTAWIGTETPAATYSGTIQYTLAMGA